MFEGARLLGRARRAAVPERPRSTIDVVRHAPSVVIVPMPRRRAGDPDPAVSRRASIVSCGNCRRAASIPAKRPKRRPRASAKKRSGWCPGGRTARRVLSRAGILRRGADLFRAYATRGRRRPIRPRKPTRMRTSTSRTSPSQEAKAMVGPRRDRRSEDGLRADAAVRGTEDGRRRGKQGGAGAPPCSVYD